LAAKWPKVAQSGERRGDVFTGEYRHTIDAKGRLAVPARFRAELSGEVYVCRWLEGCLAIFPRAAWEQLSGEVGTLPRIGDQRARDLARSVFAYAYDSQLDSQGRLLIQASLREAVGLGSEAVVIGLNDHVELWAPDRWAEYSAGINDADAFAARLSGLDI